MTEANIIMNFVNLTPEISFRNPPEVLHRHATLKGEIDAARAERMHGLIPKWYPPHTRIGDCVVTPGFTISGCNTTKTGDGFDASIVITGIMSPDITAVSSENGEIKTRSFPLYERGNPDDLRDLDLRLVKDAD